VQLAAGQLEALYASTPVGGKLLSAWVADAYEGQLKTIRREIAAGRLTGEGYPGLAKRLLNSIEGINKREAITIARTYVQSANATAQAAVYEANKDMIKALEWSAVMENGFMSTGRGTCLRCAGLDGQEYPVGKAPSCPLHPRCRCTLLPVTKGWKELGIGLPDQKRLQRAYTIRPNKNIDAGGRRKIQEVGFADKDYGDWLKTRGPKFKKDMLGPKRAELLRSGAVKDVSDFVDTKTGRLKRLDELPKAA
jgi:hypothetical protein